VQFANNYIDGSYGASKCGRIGGQVIKSTMFWAHLSALRAMLCSRVPLKNAHRHAAREHATRGIGLHSIRFNYQCRESFDRFGIMDIV
jgi:hypothetical protein